MSDASVADAPPVFTPQGGMQGNITSSQGQPPAPSGGSPLAPQSPLSALGPPPQPTPPPKYPALNAPPMPAAPQLKQQNEPAPDAKEYQQDAMEFASAMAVLGAVAGRFTRAPGGAALGAFAAALKGWQSGSLQAYENAAKKWEADTKTTLENNRQVMEQYRQALQDRKMNIDEQMSNIQLISAKYHDQMMYDAAQSKNYTMVAQIYEKNMQYTEKASEAAAKLQQKRDEQKTKNEQSATYWLSPGGQAELNAVNPDGTPKYSEAQKAGVKQMIDLYGQKQVGKSAIANDRAQFISEFEEREGRKPTSAEITDWEGNRAGATAYGRTAGTQGARVENAVNEVEQLIPQAVEASHNLPRGKFVNVNQLMQSYEKGTSDPAYNDFALANFSLVNAYTRAMNPQGVPRIQERLEQHAAGILSTATSPEAYDVQVRRLWKEVQASKTATAKTAQGRSPGDINSPVPGLDDKAAATSDDGWTVKVK
jgi:hypothetical protein